MQVAIFNPTVAADLARRAIQRDREERERAELRASVERTLAHLDAIVERRADQTDECPYCGPTWRHLYAAHPDPCPCRPAPPQYNGHTLSGTVHFDERGLPQRPVIEHSHHFGRVLSVR